VALAVSYTAKALGISRGMLVHEIQKQFPQVVVLDCHYEIYGIYSRRMYNIVRRFTPIIQEYSVDECFADITGLDQTLGCDYAEITRRIQQALESDLGCSFSIGLAPTKTLAKVASRINKPGGFAAIPVENIPLFLEKIPIGAVWGIGPRTSAQLLKQGVKTALQFSQKPEWWISEFCSKPYLEIWHELKGRALHQVHDDPDHLYKSIMKTRTFKPTRDQKYLVSELAKNIETACLRLRRYGLEAGGMSFYLKTQSFTYAHQSCDFTARLATPSYPLKLVQDIFPKIYRKGTEYRATGVTFFDIAPATLHQHELFQDPLQNDNTRGLFSVIDRVTQKYGKQALHLAQSFKARQYRFQNNPQDIQQNTGNKKRQSIPPLSIPYWGEAS
jgi:DNA polymerase-4/DNA polymerase V